MTEIGNRQALDLEALKELADKASAGPWTHEGWYRGGANESYAVWQGKPEASEPLCKTQRERQGWDDARFIAAARSAVPALVAEVERLRGTVVALECQNAEALRIVREALQRDEDFASYKGGYVLLRQTAKDVERVLSEAAHCPHAAELAVKDQAIEDIRALAEDALDADGGASFAGMFGALTNVQSLLADLSACLDGDKGDNDE